MVDESDAFVMYYAYTTANLVGDGETGGTARYRQLLLAAFANKDNPTDEDLKRPCCAGLMSCARTSVDAYHAGVWPPRWDRGLPALDEGKMPSFPGGLEALPPRVVMRVACNARLYAGCGISERSEEVPCSRFANPA